MPLKMLSQMLKSIENDGPCNQHIVDDLWKIIDAFKELPDSIIKCVTPPPNHGKDLHSIPPSSVAQQEH